MDEQTALTVMQPRQMGMISPLVNPQAAADAIARYEALKQAIVRPDDVQVIKTTQGPKKFLRKSFWRRISACFGLSLELAREEYITEDDGRVYGYTAMYRAVAPNGQSVEGDGMCMSNEKSGMTRHTVRATAHTRAKNRAISDLVGGGEVSAEEVHYDDDPNIVESDAHQPTRPTPIKASNSKPQKSLADDLATLRIRAVNAGKIKTQDDWERECRAALDLGWDGKESSLTRDDFGILLKHFATLPSAEHASLRELPVGNEALA